MRVSVHFQPYSHQLYNTLIDYSKWQSNNWMKSWRHKQIWAKIAYRRYRHHALSISSIVLNDRILSHINRILYYICVCWSFKYHWHAKWYGWNTQSPEDKVYDEEFRWDKILLRFTTWTPPLVILVHRSTYIKKSEEIQFEQIISFQNPDGCSFSGNGERSI